MCRIRVTEVLAIAHGILVQSAPHSKKQIHCLIPDTDKAVIVFCVWDYISWQAPGLKDFVFVSNNVTDKKCKMWKRDLIMTERSLCLILQWRISE
jgi:hypothetical protein